MDIKYKGTSKKALERAADKLLGDSYKLKPEKSMVPNPAYRATPIKWKLDVTHPTQGVLIITIDAKRRTTLSIQCEINCARMVFPRKFNVTQTIIDNDQVSESAISLIPKDKKEKSDQAREIKNDLIDLISETATDLLKQSGETRSIPEQITLVPPKIFRYPKMEIREGISLEELQENKLLPIDLFEFEKI